MNTDEAIAVVETYLASLVAEVEAIQFFPRDKFRYPLDSIASSMMSKVLALSKSVITLIRIGHSEEAHGLSRSIVEAALILRYLTAVPDEQANRVHAFVKFSFSYKSLWLHHARKSFAGTPTADEIERYAAQWNLSGNPKEASGHWSGLWGFAWKAQSLIHPLDRPTVDANFKVKQYVVEYTAPSQWVHCSQPALDNYVPEEGAPFRFLKASGQSGDQTRATLHIVLNYAHSVVGYSLFGLRIARPEALDDAFSKALDSLTHPGE